LRSRTLWVLAAALVLTACSQLPAGGPSSGEIYEEATDLARRFEVVALDPAVLAVLDTRVDETFAGEFSGRGGGATDAIGVGDVLSVTIFEAANGGLFSASAGTVVGGAKSVTLPNQPVSQAGTISIPYAGRIEAAGRTPEQVARTIEASLDGKAIEPQAIVTVAETVANTATVTGEVTQGGRVRLTGHGERLLDVIALAGGIAAPVREMFVQVSSGATTVRVPMQRVVDDPGENIYIRPGDTITLIRDPQSFTAFGATGVNAEVNFSGLSMSLAEALGRSGGLLDSRADPTGVFVFRSEPRELVAAMRPGSPLLASGLSDIPVVYQVDLRDPANLFLAQGFRVYDKDIVYVTNAGAADLAKFLDLIGNVTATVRNQVGIVDDVQGMVE
jgi:polysaccharide biosynthesis/export protein